MYHTEKPMTSEQMFEYEQLVANEIGYNLMTKYDEGTFLTKKAKLLISDILSMHVVYITVEGGKRGGKDVLALYAYANYLMLAPDKYHLVTGTTVDHAIRTVLESNGFGLKFLLPHGYLTTVNNRKVYRFLDFNGEEKELHFFAGRDKGDSETFRGISYGSHYANEAIQQHMDTINEGSERTIASRWRKIIHTQNPKGGSAQYYSEYEKPLICKDDEIATYKNQKRYYKEIYPQIVKEFEPKLEKDLKKLHLKYLKEFDIESIRELKPPIFRELMQKERNLRLKYQRLIDGASPSIYREFVEYYDNPNRVKNGLRYRYHHFTIRDNPALDKAKIQEVEQGYEKGSIRYKRDIEGLRASVDGAIWDTFTDANIFDYDLPDTGLERYLAVDYGMYNDFVILDCTIDEDNTVWVASEKRFKVKEEVRRPTNALYAEMVEEVIESREKGNYMAVIVDPSARPFINELNSRSILTRSADNTVSRKRDDDRTKSDQNPDKQIFGIWLVRDGFSIANKNGTRKIMINKKCTDLIEEIMGYVFDPKKLEQEKEEPLKERDHGCFVGETLIQTIQGKRPIKNIKEGDYVLSFNEETKEFEYQEVFISELTYKNAEIWEIELENGQKIRATDTHPFLTKRGWVALKHLRDDDILISMED